jgi:hypothetical protein
LEPPKVEAAQLLLVQFRTTTERNIMRTATDNKYSCTTAQITADRGEVFKADIMQVGENYVDKMQVIREEMRADYWKLHNDIGNHVFSPGGEQTAAVAKLGQLGMALQALESAYSAINSVRCW